MNGRQSVRRTRGAAGRLRRLLPVLALISALALVAPSAVALPPYPPNCNAWVTPAGAPQVSIFTIPNGSGDPFSQARSCAVPGTSVVTPIVINVLMLDVNAAPATPAVPASDLWLVTASGGMVPCATGKMTTADAPTDATGRTTFTQPLHAGGASNFPGEPMQVLYLDATGTIWVIGPILFVYVNSPDINANGVVNLSDVVLFSGDMSGAAYVYRSDFLFDLKLDLSDVVCFARAVGAVCP